MGAPPLPPLPRRERTESLPRTPIRGEGVHLLPPSGGKIEMGALLFLPLLSLDGRGLRACPVPRYGVRASPSGTPPSTQKAPSSEGRGFRGATLLYGRRTAPAASLNGHLPISLMPWAVVTAPTPSSPTAPLGFGLEAPRSIQSPRQAPAPTLPGSLRPALRRTTPDLSLCLYVYVVSSVGIPARQCQH